MSLPYEDESVVSPDGIPCRVLDVGRVDFTKAQTGRKSAQTIVRRAVGGERLETKNREGEVESVYVAKADDAIFINRHNPQDAYVPSGSDGIRWKFNEIASKGYAVIGQENNDLIVKSTTTAKILHEIIQEPTCIKNAWGAGDHQFLFAGATLKKDDKGKITGIAKDAFDATWEIVAPLSNNPPKHTP